jgi:hypothetical protein
MSTRTWFRVWGFRIWVEVLGLGVRCTGFGGGWGSKLRVWCVGVGLRDWGSEFIVQGSGFRVWGGFSV